ncbi:MAG: hypothetical protein ACMUEM_06065 [Flavobacteriales bacterium AspAUS03]
MNDLHLSKPLVSCFKNLYIPNPKGGLPPYEYSVDGGINYQKTSMFTDLIKSEQSLYIQDQKCTIKENFYTKSFTIPNLINPNGDDINDV